LQLINIIIIIIIIIIIMFDGYYGLWFWKQ